ncbi:hypothetical protein AB0M46_51205, partial [Dactylosporangium sp. NPDC051485]|uniref:hypothetical protein n=1 Tax=Dactylosporangium sp. NPDC051485 TaxID=3154846 RepID=UPI003418EF75
MPGRLWYCNAASATVTRPVRSAARPARPARAVTPRASSAAAAKARSALDLVSELYLDGSGLDIPALLTEMVQRVGEG